MSKQFKKTTLQEMVVWGDTPDDITIIYNNLIDTSRWSTHHEMVFKQGEVYYISHYSNGATERQDESPYEYDDDLVTCEEVVPKEVTRIEYVLKSEISDE